MFDVDFSEIEVRMLIAANVELPQESLTFGIVYGVKQ